MEKIKVVQVITRMDWAGAPDMVRVLMQGIDPAQFDVCLIVGQTRFACPLNEAFIAQLGMRCIRVPSLRRNINLWRDAAALIALYRIFRAEHFDIVHTHTAKAGFLARIAAHWSGAPVVVHTLHGHNLYGYGNRCTSWLIAMAEKITGRLTQAAIALTEREKQDLVQHKLYPPHVVRVIPQGLLFPVARGHDPSLANEFDIDAATVVIAAIGRLEPVKGHRFLLAALKQIAQRYPHSKALFVGEGSLRAQLENHAKALGIDAMCIFCGWREDVSQILSIVDIMVMPSLNEAVGIALIEAQAHGVAVVATRVGGIPEVVQDGVTGILVPAQDPAALAQALEKLIADADLRKRMGEAGRRFVAGKYEPAAMVSSTVALYRELLSR